MIIVALFMLLTPGLIAVRILWHKRAANGIKREDYKFIACDYMIYSFLILLAVYCFMFFTYPLRTVSFSAEIRAISHILSASFVFKYSIVALLAAVVLPFFIPWAIRFWQGLEEKRSKKIIKEKEEE